MRAYDNLKMELFTNATVLSVAMSACGKHLLTGVEHGDVSPVTVSRPLACMSSNHHHNPPCSLAHQPRRLAH